jgi:hypothetical protein
MRQTKKILVFTLIFIFAALTTISNSQKGEPETATLIINADQDQFKITNTSTDISQSIWASAFTAVTGWAKTAP